MSNEETKRDATTEEIEIPLDLHEETKRLVIKFAEAMAQKLAHAQRKYGYSDGWRSRDWMDECRLNLVEHLAKGDPRDVANYCAFLWHHKEPTAIDAVLCDFTITKSPNMSESASCSCEQMMRQLRNAEQQRDELLEALEATVEAIRLFRNEPQLERLVSLRATAGYVAMDAAMDRGTDAIDAARGVK